MEAIRKDIHADDYALSVNTSEDILKCLRAGKLDSISVISNMSCFDVCAKKYLAENSKWPKQPKLSIHINLVEGHCLSDPAKIPHLTDKNGYLANSWGRLFIWNYSPLKYKQIKAELKEEIKAQTEKYMEIYGNKAVLRFDGHQHTQMIPIVYRALLECIEEEQYKTEYIRVTKEPLMPYLKAVSLWKTYSPVNIVKNIVLNLYSFGLEKAINRQKSKQWTAPAAMLAWGVIMSGYMDKERIQKLYSDMKKCALKKGCILEIFFHPGRLMQDEIQDEYCNPDSQSFYLSDKRCAEYESIMKFEEE